MSILNLWRQFGRRYFWSHLLLGMVATGIGVPPALASVTENILHTNTSSAQRKHNQVLSSFEHLFQLQNSRCQPSNYLNYWQQHAVRNVIRRLSFAFSITEFVRNEEAKESIRIAMPFMQQLMLDTLHAMLIQAPTRFESAVDVAAVAIISSDIHTPALWVAQIQGIRAGPVANHRSLS
ncbi:secA translation cis-regulator SecM [Xenorhabdus cabanillasii]|uniref:Secretion monitor n=2 Tax=Xenorhabdus cabanillasii TaxID=351673 RepID=A0A3D9UDP0_9GAMM|nr:secA translation cis-regulator SecM [Xenorhabdus cabanillasii]PHM77785.1 SecA regulator SecM [Xenorhabdus cabanillasii JM26]REF27386.1 protein translocase subunit secM [Xenorhabdus cabanillasii]CDL87795.1 Secretion monitor [Xenorhabdus cabanillasii JM26]